MGTVIPNLDPIEPWDRIPAEPTHWYARFVRYYLAQDTPRSLTAAYRAALEVKHREQGDEAGENGRGEGKNTAPGDWRRMADKWEWRQRAEAHDVHELRIEQRQEAAKAMQVRKKRRAIIDAALELTEKTVKATKAKDVDPSSVGGLLRASLGQARVEYGDEPEQRVRHEGGVVMAHVEAKDLDEMTAEEIYARGRALAQLFTEPHGPSGEFRSPAKEFYTTGETGQDVDP